MATGFFLLDHQNRHAPRRGDGRRFWGYSTRARPVRLLAIHTAESLPDYTPPDYGAENVARYLSTTDRAASYHELVDSDSHAPLLPSRYTAFGARGFNADTYHLSVATQAARWPTMPADWTATTINRLAIRAAVRCKEFGLPVRLLTRVEVDRGFKGITSHAVLDPARRTDPGAHFPWSEFLALTDQYLHPTDDRIPHPEPEEDEMAWAPIDVIDVEGTDEVVLVNYCTLDVIEVAAEDRQHFRRLAGSAVNPQFAGPYTWPRARVEQFQRLGKAA